jgi:hypothetical protein
MHTTAASTLEIIAWTLAFWTAISVTLGLLLGYLLDRNVPKTPKWPWEK